MTIRQIEIFTTVARKKSFSLAAEALYISQPSVSVAINTLEKEFGVQLLHRSTKEVSLTKAGKALYQHAKHILASLDRTTQILGPFSNPDVSAEIQGEIELSASSVPSQYILPKLISKFNQQYPKIVFHMTQMNSSEIPKSVAEQQSEMGISGYQTESNKCDFQFLGSDDIIFVSNQPVEKPFRMTSLLTNFKLVGRRSGSGTIKYFENYLADQNIPISDIRYTAFFDNTESVLQAVFNGLGIAPVSRMAATFYLKNKLLYEITTYEQLPPRQWYLVTKKDFQLSPESQLFKSFLLDQQPLHLT